MIELNKVHNMDCMEALKSFDDNYFDLILTDPPYGINICGKVGGDKPFGSKKIKVNGDNIIKSKEYHPFNDSKPLSITQINELFRVSKNQIIFGGNYFILPPSPCWIVWDKDNTGNFADCELAWTSFKSAVRKFKWRWNGMFQEKQNRKEERFHPTQKPIELFRWILKKYLPEGGVVCDPFIGSGTTALACKSLNIDFVGFEIIKEYSDIANNRLNQSVLGEF